MKNKKTLISLSIEIIVKYGKTNPINKKELYGKLNFGDKKQSLKEWATSNSLSPHNTAMDKFTAMTHEEKITFLNEYPFLSIYKNNLCIMIDEEELHKIN